MISLLKGKVVENDGGRVTIFTSGGVGYNLCVNVATAAEWPVGGEAKILTYLSVRENALELYGFAEETERELFLHFLEVSGIGPRTAMHILSLGSADDIAGAVARGDVDYLTKVSGVGRKTAERIVVELKSKMSAAGKGRSQAGAPSGAAGDAIEGLVSMGYILQDARAAVKKLDTVGKTSEQILREALKRVK